MKKKNTCQGSQILDHNQVSLFLNLPEGAHHTS